MFEQPKLGSKLLSFFVVVSSLFFRKYLEFNGFRLYVRELDNIPIEIKVKLVRVTKRRGSLFDEKLFS